MTGAPEPSAVRPTLLAVDDSQLVRQMIRDAFRREGFEVLEAADGAAALRLLEGPRSPDAIVADVLMPGMDGWQFYREIRSRAATRDVPFVFLTVEGDPPKRVQALRLGADDYMVKPFDAEELYARVARLVRKRNAAPSSSRPRGEFPLSGRLDFLPLADLLQLLALNGKDVTVRLCQDGQEGEIVLEGGELLHARCGRLVGRKALFRILGWKQGAFSVEAGRSSLAERSLAGPTSQVVMDGLVSLDEWNRFRESLPPGDAKLHRSSGARARLRGRTITPAETEVLARLEEPVTVSELIEESPLPDAELAEAICSLLEAGILEAG